MDQARAKEVKDLCHKTAGCGPWSDRLRDHLTSDEVSEVKALWDTMPGYTSFYDAFMRFVQGRA